MLIVLSIVKMLLYDNDFIKHVNTLKSMGKVKVGTHLWPPTVYLD